MKAIIKLDVPDWQIGQEVSVYFPDTMRKHGICEKYGIILCKGCKHYEPNPYGSPGHGDCNGRCADGERRAEE